MKLIVPGDMNITMCYRPYKGLELQPPEMRPWTDAYLDQISFSTPQQNAGAFMGLAGHSQCYMPTFVYVECLILDPTK